MLTLTVAALVKPIPQFVHRIENADVIKGDFIGAFKVWPTAHPRITLAQGETLSFSLRIWPGQPALAQVAVPDSPSVDASQAQDASNAVDASKNDPLPRGALSGTVRAESTDQTYWLDVRIGPVQKPGSFRSRLVIPPGYKKLSALTSVDVLVVVRSDS
jgi:hypothetical protein